MTQTYGKIFYGACRLPDPAFIRQNDDLVLFGGLFGTW
jgi:hypothetical protein